jgi:hypothetical protein
MFSQELNGMMVQLHAATANLGILIAVLLAVAFLATVELTARKF